MIARTPDKELMLSFNEILPAKASAFTRIGPIEAVRLLSSCSSQ